MFNGSVAPHAGAWIEISSSASRYLRSAVAPHAGAWIEIDGRLHAEQHEESLPMRERGLKYANGFDIAVVDPVAPHAGAWIEIRSWRGRCRASGRSPCGSVD